jgi:hypothetical protein
MSRMFESMIRRGAGLGPAAGMQTLGPRPMSRFERAAPELAGDETAPDASGLAPMPGQAPRSAAPPVATGRGIERTVAQAVRQREGVPDPVPRIDAVAPDSDADAPAAAPSSIENATSRAHGTVPNRPPVVPAARPLPPAPPPRGARATDARPATDAPPAKDANADTPLRTGQRADAAPVAAPLARVSEAARSSDRDDGAPPPAPAAERTSLPRSERTSPPPPVEGTPSPRGEPTVSPHVERVPLPVAASPAAMIAQASSTMRGDAAPPPLSVSIGRIEIAFAPAPVPPAAPAGPQRTRGFSDLAGARRGVLR